MSVSVVLNKRFRGVYLCCGDILLLSVLKVVLFRRTILGGVPSVNDVVLVSGVPRRRGKCY